MSNYLQVSTTAATREAAGRLAGSAVSARLAASAQVHGPVTSYFWHQGVEGEGEEWQVILKTTSSRYAELEAHLIAEHEWENPEVTAIALVGAPMSYLEWLDRATAPVA